MLFLTSYELNKVEFTTTIYSDSWKIAENTIKRRGIGETILGTTDKFKGFSAEIFDNVSKELLHLVCFASWIGIKSGDYAVDEILSDTGIFHELIHISNGIDAQASYRDMQHKIKSLVYKAFNCPDNQNALHCLHNFHD